MANNSSEPIICSLFDSYVPWKNYITPITLAYGLPLLCLNARVIWVLMKNRKKEELNSSFYMVFVLASIADSSFWIVNEIVTRITMTPITNFILDWMPTRGVITSGIFFLSSYLFFTEMLLTILTSLNRLLSVVFPFSYKLIWRRIFPIGITLVFLTAWALSWELFFDDPILCKMFINPNERFYTFAINQDGNVWLPFSTALMIGSFVPAFFGLIINSITIISLIWWRKKTLHLVLAQNKNPLTRAELNLFIISLIMFINQFLVGITMILLFFSTIPASIVMLIQDGICDIMCFTPCLLLIIMSKTVRREVLNNCWATHTSSTAVSVETRKKPNITVGVGPRKKPNSNV